MSPSRFSPSSLRFELLLSAWFLTTGLACADVFDLSEDILVPLTAYQQNLEPDELIEYKQSLSLSASLGGTNAHIAPDPPLPLCRTVSADAQGDIVSKPPLYELHCVYRL